MMTKLNQGHHGFMVLCDAEKKGHTGFCMSKYDMSKCCDCFAEEECLDLFKKDQEAKPRFIPIEAGWTRAQYLQMNQIAEMNVDRGQDDGERSNTVFYYPNIS